MKYLLDSGDPDEYKEISALAKAKGDLLWGSTTNPSLIAKKLSDKKYTQNELFKLQKEIVLEILNIVPGAVSAEVYADKDTASAQMIEQGAEIAKWHKRVVVKLPTTIDGFKARTQLRKKGISTNNTLVFSQAQIYAICLHEELMQQIFQPKQGLFEPFISPFVGRLDDIQLDGMELVELGMKIKEEFQFGLWMLEASVRKTEHIKRGIECKSELITAPAKLYKEWFELSDEQKSNLDAFSYSKDLADLEIFKPSAEIKNITTIEQFETAIETHELDISHPLTDTGIERFAADWNALIG